MINCSNYIFDLYGTLIDIYTDENDPYIWTCLAGLYSRYGAEYTPDELKSAYHRIVCEELAEARRRLCASHTDVKIEKVFRCLFTDARKTHKAELYISGDSEAEIWAAAVSNIFRELSMRRFGVFPGVRETLETLRSRGAKLYLLSNAQRVFTIPEIEKAMLYDFFDALYLSSDLGVAKPEPSFLQTLLSEQKIAPSDCVFIGNDVNSDMAVASSCGVKGILLNTDRRSDSEIDELIRENRFAVIRSGRIEEILWQQF